MLFIPSTAVNQPARKAEPRDGTAVVEFALVATVFAIFMMGMVEITRAIQVKDFLTDAARSAARLGAQNTTANTDLTTNINNCLTANGFATSLATVRIKVNDVTADVSTAKKYDKISVKISIPLNSVNWVTPYFFDNTKVTSEVVVMMRS